MALTTLRKQLGDDGLLTDRETLQFNPDQPVWVDAVEFKSQIQNPKSQTSDLQSAIELYRGPLLPGLYDDWVLPLRDEAHELYLEALLRLVQHWREQSEYARAIEAAQKVLATDRANERAYQHLMFCYEASGDRSAALKQFEACQRVLREELAAEPSLNRSGNSVSSQCSERSSKREPQQLLKHR